LLHLTFEHTHPFVDGNGRIGRVINNYLLIREGFVPVNIKFIDSKFCFDKSNHFTPYAYGLLGLMYDSRYIVKPPQNYGELQDNGWDETLIMPDPEKNRDGKSIFAFNCCSVWQKWVPLSLEWDQEKYIRISSFL